jgi:predicted ester cyclase
MPVAGSKAAVKRLAEALNQGNVAAIAKMFPATLNREVRSAHKMAHTALPDLQFKIEDTIAAGDKVVIRWSAHATHKGDADIPRLGHIRATGKQISVTGITILLIKNDEIIETWGESSELDALEQIGRLPKLR